MNKLSIKLLRKCQPGIAQNKLGLEDWPYKARQLVSKSANNNRMALPVPTKAFYS